MQVLPGPAHSVGSALALSGLGLVLGMRHSTDADHIVALSTIVTRQRSIRSAAIIGGLWGVGHTITVAGVGTLIILFGKTIPTRLGLGMEFSVGVMLVVLGILNLTGLLQRISHYLLPTHQHLTAPATPIGGESSLVLTAANSLRQLGFFHGLRPLLIGLVHGLAGSAAVALLVLSTIHNRVWASVYLVIFGVGTIVGMVLMTTVFALPLVYGSQRIERLCETLKLASGVASLCFGAFLMYELGFVGGLFGPAPRWTPR